jgi:ABC-2 type transport system ATP-binding protein
MAAPVVEVAGLTVVRGGTTVLDRLDVSVQPGVTGLLGPSGCGKSTLLRSVVGVQRIAAGTVTVLGAPAGSAGLRTRVGYLTQASSVYDDLSVTENLRFFARVLGRPAGVVEETLELVDLGRHRDQVVGRLSGGQRSRVGLAAALLGDPELLVLDEPTVGLDPVLRRDLWQVFHRLAGQGKVLLISSHVMDEAERCDRLLLMREGRILAHDTPEAVKAAAGAASVEDAFLALVEGRDGDAA